MNRERAPLFLFDIDGTLLRRMPPVHSRALREAAQTVFGVRIEHAGLGPTAGMTDSAIARRMLLAAGISAETITARLPALYAVAAERYDALVPADLSAYHTPYAAEVLAWLADAGVALGLVTGNIERIAWRKLGAAGLASYFACGGFGDQAEDRNALPPLAVARAERTFGRSFAPEEVYIIGDTPLDIGCGAANQFRTVAVATGPIHSLAELEACCPDYAFPDLRGIFNLAL